MGRAPCCDKANVKRGPWSPEEDAKLKSFVDHHGTGGNWIALPQKIGLKRCGKSCRLRWLNYLRPNIKHGGFSEEEDNIICNLYLSIGSRWSVIAAQLPGRTDNDIKNYWNTKLKKKLLGKQRKDRQTAGQGKQEITKEINNPENFTIDISNINRGDPFPYFPQLPLVINPNQKPNNLEDQESIRNLLIKLGGRFTDDHPHYLNENTITNFQYPSDISSSHDQLNENSLNLTTASSTSMSPMNSVSSSQFPYGLNGSDFNTFQQFPICQFGGFERSFYPLSPGSVQWSCSNYQPGFSLNDMSSADSTNWGDMNSLLCPPVVPNYEDFLQGVLVQDCAFGEL